MRLKGAPIKSFSHLIIYCIISVLLFNSSFSFAAYKKDLGQEKSKTEQSFLKYHGDYKAKEEFLSGMIQISEDFFLPSYVFVLYLPPYGLLQYATGKILRGIGAHKKVLSRNDKRDLLTLEKLEILRPLMAGKDKDNKEEAYKEATRTLFWLWRSMRHHDNQIIDSKNRIKDHVEASTIKEHLKHFLNDMGIESPLSLAQQNKIIGEFIKSFGFVTLRDEKREDLKEALIKAELINKRSRSKNKLNKISSQEIIQILENIAITDTSSQTRILHDLGLISPEDLKSSKMKEILPQLKESTLEKYLCFKNFETDIEVQLYLDALYLLEKGKKVPSPHEVNSNKIMNLKLDYIQEVQEKRNDKTYNIVRLEKEIMEVKKNILILFDSKEIDNKYLQIKKIDPRDPVYLGLTYLTGVGIITNAALHLVTSYATIASSITKTALGVTGAGAMGVSGVLLSLTAIVGLSRDIPSYIETMTDKKITKRLREHLYEAKNLATNEDEKNSLTFKAFQSEISIFQKQETQKMLLDKMGFNGTYVVIGALATTTGAFAIMSALSVAAIAGAATPVALACELGLISAAMPLILLTVDQLHHQRKIRIAQEVKGILEKSITKKMNSPEYKEEVQGFLSHLENNPRKVIDMGIAVRSLKSLRGRMAQKHFGSHMSEMFSNRFEYIATHLIEKKSDVLKEAKKLDEEMKDDPRYQELLHKEDFTWQLDIFDDFELLPSDQKTLRNNRPRPNWMTYNKNELSLVFISSFILDAYARFKDHALNLMNFKEDKAIMEKFHLQAPHYIKKNAKLLKSKTQSNEVIYSYVYDHVKYSMEHGIQGVSITEKNQILNELDAMTRLLVEKPENFDLKTYPLLYSLLTLYVPDYAL